MVEIYISDPDNVGWTENDSCNGHAHVPKTGVGSVTLGIGMGADFCPDPSMIIVTLS